MSKLAWWLSLLLLAWFAVPLWAANPDLAVAPPPNLSQAAWAELQGRHKDTKAVTVHAQITVKHGSITDVVVKESDQLPVTAAEVQTVIKQRWKLFPAFSGTVVQPVTFKVVEGTSNPAFSVDPTPSLSRAASRELKEKAPNEPNIALHANITASHGVIQEVTVKEADQWPKASAEVAAWIKENWKFGTPFTGTTTQSVPYSLDPAAKNFAWKNSGTQIFLRSPKPQFPQQYHSAVRAFEEQNNLRRVPGVYLSMTARNGAITDIRVLDQTGPPELCTYTVNWIRQNWVPAPGINRTFALPVYYVY
jgi:hypothetical protein